VAEAYSVGQVAAAAVTATKGTVNSKIIHYLHSGVTVPTVQGSAKFNSIGENTTASMFMFQWQPTAKFVQVLPASAPGSVPILNPKPHWGS
jgi:ABC-type branched-subunit amino acid transport system substrate-binding protein